MKHLIFAILALAVFSTNSLAADFVKMISVRGEGEVSTSPDLADIQLQVSSKAKDAKTAQSKNAKEMARIEKTLKDQFKIEAKDIQTTHFQVSPEYNYENSGKRTFLGFRADHGLSVTARKLEQVGGLLDSLVGKGTEDLAVQLNGVSFSTSKRKELEIQALEQAMKLANHRAEALAGFAKKKIKGVIRITDSQLGFVPPPMTSGGMAMMKMADAESAPTRIASGEIKVQAQVAVDFEMD
jgi:uncharacterized protein